MTDTTPTTIAWINGEDIKAERLADGSEWLVVDGAPVLLTDAHHTPVQQVINYAHGNKRQRRAMRAAWKQLGWADAPLQEGPALLAACFRPLTGEG